MARPTHVSDTICCLLMLLCFIAGAVTFSGKACADDYIANKSKVIKAEAQRRAETSTGMTYQQHKQQVARELRSTPYKAYTNPVTKRKLEEIEK